ncbi:hypothetical protein SCAR479_01905 [Seiridium cardinale]|uniref:SSCRP protein n=1 Tax=Seiridium cardinale TaxID=138064 RepID=A0ABR2Y3V5_9PEZI
MQFNIGSIIILSIAAFGSLANTQAVAFGQELQNDDQTNHWVAWTEGEHACPGQQVLDVLTKSPCGQSFSLGEVEYTFSGCSGDKGPPTVLLDSGGLQIGGCKSASDKIHCHGDDHDIIKRGVCAIVN